MIKNITTDEEEQETKRRDCKIQDDPKDSNFGKKSNITEEM